MSPRQELDLRGVGLPLSLLKFKKALDKMDSGGLLEVLVEDPSVVADLERIIRHTRGGVVSPQREGDYYRVQIGCDLSQVP